MEDQKQFDIKECTKKLQLLYPDFSDIKLEDVSNEDTVGLSYEFTLDEQRGSGCYKVSRDDMGIRKEDDVKQTLFGRVGVSLVYFKFHNWQDEREEEDPDVDS